MAITFISDKDQRDFKKIEELIETEVYKSPLPKGMEPGPEYKPKKRNFRKKNYRR